MAACRCSRVRTSSAASITSARTIRPIVEQEHLEAALKRFELVYVEMEAGDVLVFDGNLLHRSDANRSNTYRWGYICSYNAVENAPFKKVREYGNYEELRKVPAGSFRFAS